MALSRLLVSEAELHLSKEGFSGSRRWLSGSSTKKGLTKSESTKEKRTEDVKSFLERYSLSYKRYMEEKPGLFPKITEVHKAVGGSYNVLKGVYSKFQEKFLPHSANTTQQGEVTKPCSNESSNESRNGISLASEQTKQCAEVLNETSSSSANIEVLTENSVASPVNEKSQNLDLDSLKVGVEMADVEKSDFELKTKKKDFRRREHFSGSETRSTYNENAQQSKDSRRVHNTSHGPLYNVIKGLKNGPKGTVETTSAGSKGASTVGLGSTELLSSVKEQLFERRGLNGTKGSSVIEKDKKMFELFDVFKKVNSKPENSVDGTEKTNNESMHDTMIREEKGARSGDDYDHLGSLFSQIITKSEKQSCTNTRSLAHTLPNKKSPGYIKALNILSEETKDVGQITEVLREEDRSAKVMENENSDSDIAASDYLDFQPAVVAPIPIPKERSKYGMFVSFLDKTTTASDVCHAFDGYGPLHEVHFISSRKLDRYKCANVFFKAEQGLKNALNNTDPVICNTDVVVQPMTSHPSKRLKVSADMVVQDPDFPEIFLECPSRSVAVQGLLQDLPFKRLRHALGFWGTISGVAIGQSCSSVYVEFETEESKERVLEAANVTVLGKKLHIYRVNAPKTTVVRVSTVNSRTDENMIKRISNRFSNGNVKRVVQRGPNIFDVHFKLSELPNMLKILNRLNGLVVDESQWVVKPATFIPVEIIQSLWDDPRGRKQVQEILQDLCMKVGGKSSKNTFDIWSTVKTEVD